MTRFARATLVSMAMTCVLASSGCNTASMMLGQVTNQTKVKGSGVADTQQRSVGKFSRLNVSSAIHANVTVGGAQKIVVTADDNIVPLIKTEVRKKTLYLSLEPRTSINTTTGMEVSVTVPELSAINCSGATQVNVKSLSGDTFFVDASGAARIQLEGAITRLELDASGSAKIDAKKAKTESVKVDASGAAKIQVFATGSVAGGASGAANIQVSGGPHTTKIDRSGASKVSYDNE